ncbi:hypothetical protein [Galbibacter sp.]|uniref:hypothetical protein n=1 Tax=Galbibacter sp. TaxID=2918471 RepID=UPI003A8F06C9
MWTSSNQHGVHSPFVYQLLTNALYRNTKSPESELFLQWQRKHNIRNPRKIKIINRALAYLNDASFSNAHTGGYTADRTLYINLMEQSHVEILHKLISHPFVIVDHIDKQHEKWQKICHSPNVTLSIDFYTIGFLFYKPGQHKENFKIRI